MSRFDELDAKYLPGLAQRYVGARERVGTLRRRAHHTAKHGGRQAALQALDQLDSTVASKRWGRSASNPYLALLAAGTVFAAAIGVLIIRPVGTTPDRSEGGPTNNIVSSTYVGPQVGDEVAAYIAKRNSELKRLSISVPDGPTLAVVSFSRFTSIEDAAAILASVGTRRVFFGVPLEGSPTEIGQSAVSDFVKDTKAAFLSNSQARAKLATTFGQFANAAPARTDVEKQYKKLYGKFSKNNEIESKELGKLCACVIGAVVDSTMKTLQALEEIPGVRVVDVAPADVPANSLGFRPIAPDEVGTITAGTGDGQLGELAPPQ